MGLKEKLSQWHGGQTSPTYAAASTMQAGRVPDAGIMASAIDELEDTLQYVTGAEDRRDLTQTIEDAKRYRALLDRQN